MTRKIITVFFLCAALLCSCVACSSKTDATLLVIANEDTNKNAEIVTFAEATTIADNGTQVLEYDAPETRLNIRDKQTGELLWSTGVTEEEYGQPIANKLTRQALKQFVKVKYTDFDSKTGAVNSGQSECTTTLRKIPDGLRFDFAFDKFDLGLSLEFTLTDTGLSVYMPKQSVKESGKYKITSIDVLPMFGASRSDVDGYFMVPDGSGALYRFGKNQTIETVLNMEIYDAMLADLDETKEEMEQGICKVMAPVFGIKHPKKAVFANITDGEENCFLTLQTDGGAYKVNTLFPVVSVRKQFTMKTASGSEVVAYEKNEYISDLRINYSFLGGENPGYSDMAKLYRDYLLNEGHLKSVQEKTDTYPVAVDFLVSVTKDTMMYKESIVTTSFSDVSLILDELREKGVSVEKSILYGWQSSGYYNYPMSNKVSSGAGGKKDLADLISAQSNTKFYLLQNYMNANKDGKGFSVYSDVVYRIDNVPLTDDDEERYLLNLVTQKKKLLSGCKLSAGLGTGVAMEGFGSTLYEDYEDSRRITRTGFKQLCTDLFRTAKEQAVPVAMDGFAPYLLENSDYAFNLPMKASNYILLSEQVPFLQMVLHGYYPYSDVVPGNLSNDLTETKLRWIEYGYTPTFLLTYKNGDKLKDTDFNLLFSSEYTLWGDDIVEIGREFSEKLASVYYSPMVYHTVENNVATVKYENGKTVMINYNNTDVTVNGVVIKARDYIII